MKCSSQMVLVGRQNGTLPLGKQLDSFFKNLNMHLPYDMIIPVLEIYREEWRKHGVHRRTCTRMFLATLFVTAKCWEPNCPPTEEWVNCSIFTQRILFSNLKKEWLLLDAVRWMTSIQWSSWKPDLKNTYFSHDSIHRKVSKMENRLVVSWRQGKSWKERL